MLGGEKAVELWFTVDGTWGRGSARVFKGIHHEFQPVLDGTATDLLWFLSGLPVLLPWERTKCQVMNVDSPWNLGKGVFHVFQSSPTWIPNCSIWNCDRSTLIPVWTPRALPLWGGSECQAVDFDSQWMEPNEGGLASVSKQCLMKSEEFQMELWHLYSDFHLDSQCFYNWGELAI